MKLLSTLLFLLISLPALSAKYIGYLGGSGDPPGITTIFDTKIAPISKYAAQSGAQVNVAFDGGHEITEANLKRSFPRTPIQEFNKTTYEQTIAQYETGIRNGTIKSGDQLLMVIDTHGAKRLGNTQTHTISSGRKVAVDLNDLKGSETVSLDRLMTLTKLAEEKGIKLGIMDLSCHSGASLPLANSKTCVIAAGGPQSFAYGGTNPSIFSNRLATAMVPGKNLEEVFLTSRAGSTDLGFAMISTDSGKRVQNQLYPLLMKYLNRFDNKSDKFTPEILESVKTQSCLQENAGVEEILELTRQIEAAIPEISLEAFRNSLTEYHDYRRSIQDQLLEIGVGKINETRNICANDGYCQALPLDLVMGFAVKENIANAEKNLQNAKTPSDRREAAKWLSYFQNAKVVQEETRREFPHLASYGDFVKNLPNVHKRTTELASKVSIESRKIYSALYRRTSTPNPCRDFVL